MAVRVTVQHVPGCPSVPLVLDRLDRAVAQLGGPPPRVATEEIADPDRARDLAFSGSPTILVDGEDPFAEPGAAPAFACRVYRTEAGAEGSPSVTQLRRALAAAVDDPATPDDSAAPAAPAAGT